MSSLYLYVGRDKGNAIIIAAPDLDNAQTMVDASTTLYCIGVLVGPFDLRHQGPIDPEALLALYD